MKVRKKSNGNADSPDPTDGQAIQVVGPWALQKHHYLRYFIDATGHVRAKFLPPTGVGACFVDLFAGNGRAIVDDNGERVDGSPMIAARSSVPFSKLILCDKEEENADALRVRTANIDVNAVVMCGDSNALIDGVTEQLAPNGYHLALVDPFGATGLVWDTIEKLARFQRMDMILHFPVADMKRNFRAVARLERAVGRKCADWGFPFRGANDVPRLVEVYAQQLHALGYISQHTIRSPQICRDDGLPLYNLLFASRHDLGAKIWNSVTKNAPQAQLGFSLVI